VAVARDDDTARSKALRNAPERFQPSHRAFAEHIAVKLQQLGPQRANGTGPAYPFSHATLERLAELERWRWSAEARLPAGKMARGHNDIGMHPPPLVDWALMPDDIKAMNHDSVRPIQKSRRRRYDDPI
jgi:hypothetical protein